MTKYYCDKCGKECKKLRYIRVPCEKLDSGYKIKELYVCEKCEQEHEKINKRVTEMILLMHSDFLKEVASDD